MQTPSSATPAEKLERIIIADLEFRSLSVREAIEFLWLESGRLDTGETNPARKGVPLWMAPVVAAKLYAAGENGDVPRVTLKFSNVSLGEAIRYTAHQVGLEMHVSDSGVFLWYPVPQPPPDPVATEEAPSPVDPDEVPLERYLNAADGYLALGMEQESVEELQHIVGRLEAAENAKNWQAMEAAARALCQACPTQAAWPIHLATAVRHGRSLEDGLIVLYDAVQRLPDEATIYFSLACLEAQYGHLDIARGYLADAERLMPEICAFVAGTPDLAALHDDSAAC